MFDAIRRSLRLKVVALVVGITFATLLLTSALLILYDLRTARRGWVTDLITQADLVGTASAPVVEKCWHLTMNSSGRIISVRWLPRSFKAAWLMSELGLGGRQIFPFFCSRHHHRAQNSGCGYTA